MTTQMTSARRGVATDEMKQVAKDEDVSLEWLIPKIAKGSIIIPSNNVRPQKIHNVGIGKGLKTKVNVNIGTSTLNVNIEEEVEKAKVAIKYHADTIMDLSDGGDVKKIRQTLMDAAPITFGTVPIYEAYNYGVEVHKNPLNLTEDITSKHLKIMQKMGLTIPLFTVESQKILQKEFLKFNDMVAL